MEDTVITQTDGCVIWSDPALLPKPDVKLFDPEWLRVQGHLTGTSTGRNTAWFLHLAGRDMVLRHCWRGGMVGRIISDRYLRQPIAQSRAMREFSLLRWMHAQGLPVPRAIAARFAPAGLWYKADLLMERIADTAPLADDLATTKLPAALWHKIGAVIAQMHALGVQHSDLNCRNILLDAQDRVWLIDFDKCDRRPVKDGSMPDWAQSNLDRLHRSLTKEKGKVADLHWSPDDWEALLTGYHSLTAEPVGRAP